MGRGWAAPEVACRLHPVSKPLTLLQRPMHLTGDLHWPWWAAARVGCVWAVCGQGACVLGSLTQQLLPQLSAAGWQQRGLSGRYVWLRALLMKAAFSKHIL